jgi:hypothetical protein
MFSLAKPVRAFKYSRNFRGAFLERAGKNLAAKANGGESVGFVDDEFLALIVMGLCPGTCDPSNRPRRTLKSSLTD